MAKRKPKPDVQPTPDPASDLSLLTPEEIARRRKAKAGRCTPTQMRLTPEDLAGLEEIRQAHRLPNRTEATRLAIREKVERLRKEAEKNSGK